MSMKDSKAFANTVASRFDPQFIQIAKVMDNRDPTRNGKLKVWVENSQSTEDDKNSWITCRYSSIFAGRTPGQSGADEFSQYPKSYGFWAVPPDVGTKVAIFFANANIHDAYWFSCVFDERMNTMVPGTATQMMEDTGYDMPIPVTEYDRNTIETSVSEKYINVPLVNGLQKQNLLYDEVRGLANRSSTRTVINSVYGMNTPRGQSIIMDDGYRDSELSGTTWDDDPDGYQNTQYNNAANDTSTGSRKQEGIVLKTRSGAQILLSESDGIVFIINRDGTARIEMEQDGNIVVHSDKSISFKATEDINLMAGQNINMDVGNTLNLLTGANAHFEIGSNFDITTGSQLVANSSGELRLVSSSGTRVQGSSVDISSSGNISSTSGGSNNMSGSSVNLSGSNSDLSLSSEMSSNTAMKALDFITPVAGFNSHNHRHKSFNDASSHSDEMDSPYNGGASGKPQKAIPAQPATDIAPAKPEQTEQEEVQFISSTESVEATLTQDLLTGSVGADPNSLESRQTYEGIRMFMPCTGQIREFGYWGKEVPDENGQKVSRSGWDIQCKGDVIAPERGTIAIMGTALIVNHQNGYKSVFYGVDTKLYHGMEVNKGDSIGTSSGLIKFEIRKSSANIYGFNGSIDPGLFYTKETGVNDQCANKSLTKGKASLPENKQTERTKPSRNSDELVTMTRVKGIGSKLPQRGSKRVPNRTKTKEKQTKNVPGNGYHVEDLSGVDKTPHSWMVEAHDPQMVDDLKRLEGDIAYQTRIGTYKNGRFYKYVDMYGYSIGYGHFLKQGETFSNGITEAEADKILVHDISLSINEAKKIYAQYKMKMPYMAQIVLAQMVFGIGAGGTRKFKNMLKHMAQGKYRLAANDLRDSLMYRQIPNRVELLAKRLEACE